MKPILDPNLRSAVEWQQALGVLIDALSTSTGIAFQPTSWLVEDDQPGFSCACNCVNLRGTINPALQLDACGVLCVTINFGEAAWASCDLLLFAAGRRVRGPDGADIIHFSYRDVGWVDNGWIADDNQEWESHTTDEWWQRA
ncbi:Hypothetical protein A7982_06412 [Minicystis rosea]|nr:Hypothetical protein A7982_06412 [Minicystis rosea]